MRIVVAYKWAPNPQDATVGRDGRVDWSRTRATVSDYDAVAAELARRVVDAGGGEVVGVCVGPAAAGSGAARKAALPKGYDRAVIVADDRLDHLDTATTAAYLAALVRRIGEVGAVLCGDGSTDVGAKLVPAYLAGLLGWPCLMEVTALSGAPGEWVVERAYGAGTQQLRATAPLVLGVATDAAVPRAAGMKDILAASKKPVETLTADDLAEVGGVVGLRAGGVELIEARPPVLRPRRHQIFDGEPAAAARDLVAALRTEGVL